VTRDLVGDTGTAARFFYSAKASRKDRQGRHPTQKPLSLMRYLCRMHTPPGGVILDPFSGSGSTLEAAIMEGFQAVGCELTPEYFPDIEARLRRCQPDLLPEAVPDGAA
jgi:site-specific DNA-methyltransferase (adenine-specific)